MRTIVTEKHQKEMKNLLGLIDDGLLDMLSDLGCIVAGGAVTSMFTNKEVNDLDIYFPSKEAFTTAMREIFRYDSYWNRKLGYECIYDVGQFEAIVNVVTSKAVLITTKSGTKIQFVVHKFYDNAHEIFEDFDFTVCCGALLLKTNTWALHEDFLKHCSQRYIHFNPGTAYPIISALRVHKYKEKGFNIPKAQFLKIMLAINAKDISTWETFIGELSGMYGTPPEQMFDTSKPFDMAEAITQLDDIVVTEKMIAKSWGGLDQIVKIIPHAFTDAALEAAGILTKKEIVEFGELAKNITSAGRLPRVASVHVELEDW